MSPPKVQKQLKLDGTSGVVLGLGMGISIGMLLLFSWLGEEVLEGDTSQFDMNVRALVHAHSTDGLTQVMKIFTTVGSSLILIPLAILVLSLCLYHHAYDHFATVAGAVLGAILLEAVLKLAFHRRRPVPYFGLATPRSYSFPSGHALSSFCLCGALALVLTSFVSAKPWRAVIWFVAVMMAVAIGFSRIYLGVHYPTDVIAGYAGGFIWLSAVAFTDALYRRRVQRRRAHLSAA